MTEPALSRGRAMPIRSEAVRGRTPRWAAWLVVGVIACWGISPVHAAGAPPASAGEHGAHDDHVPGEINWFQGFVGESDEYEPGFLFRPVGTPAPFGATLLNTAILFFLIYKFGKKPLVEGLKKRKAAIMKGMDDAAKMKEEAAAQLAHYRQKLEQIDQEITRVKSQMREAAEAERQRVLADAKERQARMERDAKLLIEQELKAARQDLMSKTAQGAVQSAEEMLRSTLGAADHERLTEEYLGALDRGLVGAPGGRA